MGRVKRMTCSIIGLIILSMLISFPEVGWGAENFVVSFNMGTSSEPWPDLGDIAEAVRAAGEADVLLAQETPWPVKHDALARELGFAHYLSARDMKPMSNRAIFSRTPLRDPFTISLEGVKGESSGPGAFCAFTSWDGEDMLLCSVHLETIREELAPGESLSDPLVVLKYLKQEYFEENIRSRSVDLLLNRLERIGAEQVVVGGDFNTFPFSRAIRRMNTVFDDAFWLSPAFFKGSYVGFSLPLNPRIDFIFHSPGLSAEDPAVHEQTAGDHVPVSARIVLK